MEKKYFHTFREAYAHLRGKTEEYKPIKVEKKPKKAKKPKKKESE